MSSAPPAVQVAESRKAAPSMAQLFCVPAHPFGLTLKCICLAITTLRKHEREMRALAGGPFGTHLYRGMADLRMPDAFEDLGLGAELNVISASPEEQVAVSYAVSRAKERVLVLELACDEELRGCSTSWLSVYPLEQEEVLPPLSILQPNGVFRDELVTLNVGADMNAHSGSGELPSIAGQQLLRKKTITKRVVPLKLFEIADYDL